MRVRLVVSCVLLAGLALSGRAGAAAVDDWPGYLFDVSHRSFTASATITPADVASLHQVWHFKPPPDASRPPPQIFASPTVVGGRVYVGFNNGVFYALNVATGAKIWERFLGFVPQITCTARGFTSTATVVPDPVSGVLTVYVNAGDGYLYALNAGTGATIWRSLVAPNSTTENGYYNWTSPAVANGKVYVGLSSECDEPFVRGGVKAFDQRTGALVATHWTMPSGKVGGGVWSSIAVAPGGEVYATTGSTNAAPYPQGESYSIVQLRGRTLAEDGIWKVPPADLGFDSDFGASPTIFSPTIGGVTMRLVSACNKNGYLYAWRANDVSAGPVWRARINTSKVGPCFASAINDRTALYQAGNQTRIDGVGFRGSISKIDRSTGAFIWRTGLPGSVFGTPSMNGAGVIAVPTFDDGSAANGTYFVSASTGAILGHISLANAKQFGQPVFAAGRLLLGQVNQGLNAYAP
jgi:outer membrane protein assembly factor BamB